MIYLWTAIGLSPGGSSAVHIYTKTIHRTIQNKQHNSLEECGPCPVLASYTLAFALQPKKKHDNRGKSFYLTLPYLTLPYLTLPFYFWNYEEYVNTTCGQKAEFVYLKGSGVFVVMDVPLVFNCNFMTAYCLWSGYVKYLCHVLGKSNAEPDKCES